MSRYTRRFGFRVTAAATAALVGYAVHQRYRLRSGAMQIPPQTQAPLSRRERVNLLTTAGSTSHGGRGVRNSEFDVLVIGGGLVGLYTAVDAAQRGLSVAVLEAGDFGCGTTSETPPLLPGPFAFFQRALRQRDANWLWRGMEAMQAATVWNSAAPLCCRLDASGFQQDQTSAATPTDSAATFIPAMHTSELIESFLAVTLEALLSPFCGSVCLPTYVTAASARRLLNAAAPRTKDVQGGVVVKDSLLDGARAAVCLARTAEALGAVVLSYAPVVRIERAATGEDNGHCPCLVSFEDDVARRDQGTKAAAIHQVSARVVLNCTGTLVEQFAEVANVTLPGPSAVERYQRTTYLVVNTEDLLTWVDDPTESGGKPPRRFKDGRVNGLVAFSLSSYAYATVIPWVNGCSLIGVSTMPVSRQQHGGVAWAPDAPRTVDSAQRNFILANLRAFGVEVDSKAPLTCLTSTVPVLRKTSNLQLGEGVLWNGYSIVADRANRMCHVYGGTALTARSIAEKMLDYITGATPIECGLSGASDSAPADSWLPLATCRGLPRCRTATLALVGGGHAKFDAGSDEAEGPRGARRAAPWQSYIDKVSHFVREEYCTTLVDLIARRWRVAYSNPLQTLEALPALADIMGLELEWNDQRKSLELKRAALFLRSVVAECE